MRLITILLTKKRHRKPTLLYQFIFNSWPWKRYRVDEDSVYFQFVAVEEV
jgi:hypothetical protein